MKTTRPYRVEFAGGYFDVPTCTTEERARIAVTRFQGRHFVKPGTAWKITKRTGKGRETEPVAEGKVK
ncbi:MAG TPA: hypothetical protein VN797_10045 [Gemmatimonadaceae bacterium]|nr:hypothetical protein [Gemmatimonadaceae bacterium]